MTSGGVTTLYAGDGDSALRVYNATNQSGDPVFLQSLATGGTTRVDEMAFSPLTNQVLAANNAETPAYGNLFSTSNGHPLVTLGVSPSSSPRKPGWDQCRRHGAAGVESANHNNGGGPRSGFLFRSCWDTPRNPNNPGGVAQINTAGIVLQTIDFGTLPGISSAGCSPTGLAVSGNGNMLVGCGNVGTQAVLLDKNGQFLKFVGAGTLGGTDEIWYDPTTNEFYVTGNDGTNTSRFFDVVHRRWHHCPDRQSADATSAHSIAVDPFNGDVFVALAGTTTVDPCPATTSKSGLHRGVFAGCRRRPRAGQPAASGRRVGRPGRPRGAPPAPVSRRGGCRPGA